MKFKNLVTLIIVFGTVGVVNANIANFDDLSLSANSYWNGSDGTGDFTSGSAVFNNNYRLATLLQSGTAGHTQISPTPQPRDIQISTVLLQARHKAVQTMASLISAGLNRLR